MAKPRFPQNRPADISLDDWNALQHNPECSNLHIQCGGLVCQAVDEDDYYDVDVHHIIPRAQGGCSKLENLRVLCRARNQHIGPRRDPDFSGTYYFDQAIDTTKLRQHQDERAYRIPQFTHRDLFLYDLSMVLNRIMVFGWMMGAGKTVGICAFLFGINQLRAPFGAYRIRRVLWMVHQESLVKLVEAELGGNKGKGIQSDLVKHGIIANAPITHAPEDTSALSARPDADIVVICPQTLWDAKNRALSKEERRRFLASFDAIVIDEGHFAIDRYVEIMDAAPKAFKIMATATAMDADGTLLCDIEKQKYRDRFVLVSVFDYQTGRDAGIYKHLMPFASGKANDRYVAVPGGDADVSEGETSRQERNTRERLNVHRTMALVHASVSRAVALDALNGAFNQIMIRVDSKPKATTLADAINEDPVLSKHGALALYSGVKGSDQLHHRANPWMRVRDGHLGVRILICIDMGQCGLNNPLCSIIAWRDGNLSLIEIVQRIGRAVRPIGGSSKDEDGQLVLLLWRDDPAFELRIERAIDYIMNMEERLTSRFLSLSDLKNPAELPPPVSHTLLTTGDKMKLITLAAGNPHASTEELVQMFVESPDPIKVGLGGRIDAAIDYVDDVIYPPPDDHIKVENAQSQLLGMLGLTNPPKQGNLNGGKVLPDHPVSRDPYIPYVQNESPPDNYTDEQLSNAIPDFPQFDGNHEYWRAQIRDSQPTKEMMINLMRQRDANAYKAPKLRWKIHQVVRGLTKSELEELPKGIVAPVSIVGKFYNDYLKDSGYVAVPQLRELVPQIANIAAAKSLNVADLKQNRDWIAKHHVQISDVLLDPKSQVKITRMMLRILLQRHGHLAPLLAKGFSEVLNGVPDVDNEGIGREDPR